MIPGVLIRIEGTQLPGRRFRPPPGPADGPASGHADVHVAVQGRKGQRDLLGPVPGDAPGAAWELECTVVPADPGVDLRGPYLQGTPGQRFIYLSWGEPDGAGAFRMFRRAKLWLDGVPPAVLAEACDTGVLVGRLALTDAKGGPVCASVRPPRIEWTSGRS